MKLVERSSHGRSCRTVQAKKANLLFKQPQVVETETWKMMGTVRYSTISVSYMQPEGLTYHICVCVDYTDFHNLVLTLFYGIECPVCGTSAGCNQSLHKAGHLQTTWTWLAWELWSRTNLWWYIYHLYPFMDCSPSHHIEKWGWGNQYNPMFNLGRGWEAIAETGHSTKEQKPYLACKRDVTPKIYTSQDANERWGIQWGHNN